MNIGERSSFGAMRREAGDLNRGKKMEKQQSKLDGAAQVKDNHYISFRIITSCEPNSMPRAVAYTKPLFMAVKFCSPHFAPSPATVSAATKLTTHRFGFLRLIVLETKDLGFRRARHLSHSPRKVARRLKQFWQYCCCLTWAPPKVDAVQE